MTPTNNTIHTLIQDEDGNIVSAKSRIMKNLYKENRGFLFLHNSYTSVRMVPYDLLFPDGVGRLDKSYWVDILKMSKHNALPPVAELAEHLSLSVRRTYALIQRLHKCDMVRKQGKQWYANPIYGFHGKWLSPELFNLFRDDLTYQLPGWVVQRFLADLGE